MEGLNGLLREATKKTLFQGFLVGRNEVEVSIYSTLTIQYSLEKHPWKMSKRSR